MASIFLRGKFYYIRYYENGVPVQYSLETMNKKMAEVEKKKVENRLFLGETESRSKDFPAIEAIDAYEKYCLARNVKKTVHDDIKRIKGFITAKSIKHVQKITVNELSSYLDEKILKKKFKKSTANRTITNVKTWLNFCIDHELIKSNPIARIKTYSKLEKNPVRFYDKNNMEKILAAAAELGSEYHKMIGLGIFAGLRVSEILNIEWQNIDFDKKIIQVVNKDSFKTKSRKFRIIPLNSRLNDILKPCKLESGLCVFPDRKFITAPKFHLYKIQKKAELKEEGFHILRHTFGARLAEAGVSPYKIKEWMGHSSLRMTEIYMHLTPQHDEEINRI